MENIKLENEVVSFKCVPDEAHQLVLTALENVREEDKINVLIWVAKTGRKYGVALESDHPALKANSYTNIENIAFQRSEFIYKLGI